MMAMTGVAPVAVWDAGDPGWARYCRLMEARAAWLRGQGLPADQMYRAEFLLIDAPCARIFCYALNAEGRTYKDADGEVATEPPRIVPLADLPPRELLEG
jgi:hypothetical protein